MPIDVRIHMFLNQTPTNNFPFASFPLVQFLLIVLPLKFTSIKNECPAWVAYCQGHAWAASHTHLVIESGPSIETNENQIFFLDDHYRSRGFEQPVFLKPRPNVRSQSGASASVPLTMVDEMLRQCGEDYRQRMSGYKEESKNWRGRNDEEKTRRKKGREKSRQRNVEKNEKKETKRKKNKEKQTASSITIHLQYSFAEKMR